MRRMILTILLFVSLLIGCETTSITKESVSDIKEVMAQNSIETTKEETLSTDVGFLTAKAAVEAIGIGWNLGNTLDSCDYKRYTKQSAFLKKSDYQLMAVYENKNWSGWDASDTLYFGSDGSVNLSWQITTLNSDKGGSCGKFSFQLINHEITEIDDSNVEFSVTKAVFTTKSGKEVTLKNMLGKHKSTIKKGVTSYVVENLTKSTALKTASDIVGGTLSLTVKITKYPVPQIENTEKTANVYYETLWGNPVTTKAMIDKVAQAGFKAVRIPITYYDHMNKKGEIYQSFLKRVKEVVDYVIANDMYCIINIQHDVGQGAWIVADMDTITTQKENLDKLWKQIALYFKDYDEKLMFEGFNEILNKKSQWKYVEEEDYRAVNQLNQQFVDTVRATGGNNGERNLIVTTYGAGTTEDILSSFQMPADSAKNHLIGEVHYYSDLDEEPAAMEKVFERLAQTFDSKEIPLIIGEFAPKNTWSEEDSLSYIKTFMENAKTNGYGVFWWDRGAEEKTESEDTISLLDRKNLTWYSKEILDTIFLKESEQ